MAPKYRIRRQYASLINRGQDQHQSAWHTIMKASLVFTGATLIVYSILLLWINHSLVLEIGSAVVYSGSCSRASRVTTIAQVLANVIATVLFAAATYTAQILLCPTREEVDRAHARDRWMHIGASGFRNMRWISKGRLVTCVVLYVHAVLLHSFHNSTIFSSVATTDSMVTLVTEDFFHGSSIDETIVTSIFETKATKYQEQFLPGSFTSNFYNYSGVLYQMQSNSEALTRLSAAECRLAFSSLGLPAAFSNVLLVTSSPNAGTASVMTGDLQSPEMLANFELVDKLAYRNWFSTYGIVPLFHNHCSHADFDFGNDDAWNIPVWDYYCTVSSFPVEYCLAQEFSPGCSTNLNIRMFIAATFGVFVQFLCLGYVLCLAKFRPLATVGDAIAVFVERPDPTTANMKNVSIKSIHSPLNRFDMFGFIRSNEDVLYWKKNWPSWRAAVDTEFCSLMILTLFLAYFALATATLVIFNDGTAEHTNPTSLLSPPTKNSLIPSLLILNVSHIAISIAWLSYNHLWSRMFAAAEMGASIEDSTSLRLSRNSYHLCIPHYISIPTNMAIAVLHWLVTRGLNAVAINIYDIVGQLSRVRVVYGTNFWASMLALVVSALFVVLLAWGLERPLREDMPVFGSCSMAISTACHKQRAGSNDL